MGRWESYGGMMLVTDGRTGEICSGSMLVGDGRKGVNRLDNSYTYRPSRIALRAVHCRTRSVGRSVCNSIPVLTVHGWTLYTSTVVCIILSIMTV